MSTLPVSFPLPAPEVDLLRIAETAEHQREQLAELALRQWREWQEAQDAASRGNGAEEPTAA